MKENNGEDISKPALKVEKLIRQFDRILATAGVVQINNSIAIAKKENKESVLNYLVDALEKASYIKLEQKYEEIIDLVAENIVNIEEEEYFNDVKLPSIPELNHTNSHNLKEIIQYVALVREAIQPLIDIEVTLKNRSHLLSIIEKKKRTLEKGFFYEFTEGDLKRIQQLINELREQITESELFDDDHKRRLLKRLEVLQSEMHKKMSDIDRIWGLVGDAGVAIGKFGRDAKPFVDRIKELSQIAWRTQARAEELPSSSTNPLLEDTDDDK